MTASPQNHTLKRLGFVKDGASYMTSVASSTEGLYKTLKGAAPSFIQPTLSTIEERVVAVTAPVVAKATDAGAAALVVADTQVDYLLSTADALTAGGKKSVADGLTSVRELHEANMKTFNTATAQYYDYIQKIADWAAVKLNPVTGGQAAVDALRASVDKAVQLADPDVVAARLTDAWNTFASVPVVHKVLETADPVTKPLFTSFYRLHDNLVSWGLYKRLVDTGASTLSWATATTPYKLGAQYVYPVVAPVADPTLQKLSTSKLISSTLQYWKPTATAA